jgi:membrane protease YdiL (CAAX protease family)
LLRARGYALPTIDGFVSGQGFAFQDACHVLVSVTFSLAVYGPLVAAIVATLVGGGGGALRELPGRVVRWRVPLRWYLIIASLAAAMPFVPLAIGALAGMLQLKPGVLLSLLPAVPYLLPYQLLTSGLGEEPGWRGYLLPALQARLDGDKPLWWGGLIWAIWHYPFTIYVTWFSMVDLPVAAKASMFVPALAGQTMSLIGISYLYAWLVNRTGSVFLAICFHALTNVANALAMGMVEAPQFLTLAVALMPWAIVLILRRVYGKARFPGSPGGRQERAGSLE